MDIQTKYQPAVPSVVKNDLKVLFPSSNQDPKTRSILIYSLDAFAQKLPINTHSVQRAQFLHENTLLTTTR